MSKKTMYESEDEESTLFLEQPSEYDIVVNMSPRKSYTIILKIESVSRAHPNIVESKEER